MSLGVEGEGVQGALPDSLLHVDKFGEVVAEDVEREFNEAYEYKCIYFLHFNFLISSNLILIE